MTVDFEALYREHYRRVYGLCRRLLGVHAQAEDATQEAFLRAYRALGSYDGAQSFGAWVSGIASNHCIDLLRRRSLEPQPFGDPDAEMAALRSDAPAAPEVLVDAERSSGVRAALAALPDRYRVPLVLAYFDEWSYDEIAGQLGITRNHVGVLLLRARRALRQRLVEARDDATSAMEDAE